MFVRGKGGGSEKKHRVFSERVPIFLGDAIFPRGYQFSEGMPFILEGLPLNSRGYQFFRGDTSFPRGYQ